MFQSLVKIDTSGYTRVTGLCYGSYFVDKTFMNKLLTYLLFSCRETGFEGRIGEGVGLEWVGLHTWSLVSWTLQSGGTRGSSPVLVRIKVPYPGNDTVSDQDGQTRSRKGP